MNKTNAEQPVGKNHIPAAAKEPVFLPALPTFLNRRRELGRGLDQPVKRRRAADTESDKRRERRWSRIRAMSLIHRLMIHPNLLLRNGSKKVSGAGRKRADGHGVLCHFGGAVGRLGGKSVTKVGRRLAG